jgi:hypothetical protein
MPDVYSFNVGAKIQQIAEINKGKCQKLHKSVNFLLFHQLFELGDFQFRTMDAFLCMLWTALFFFSAFSIIRIEDFLNTLG